MLAVAVLSGPQGLSARLAARAAGVVVPPKPPGMERALPPWTPAAQMDPYSRALNERGRWSALAKTASELALALADTGLEPHHELLFLALAGAAAAQEQAAQAPGLDPAERGRRTSRAKTLRELLAEAVAVVREHRYGDGHKPRTFRLMGPEYAAAQLWGAVSTYFREAALTAADPLVQGPAGTLFERTREEYAYLRGLVPPLPEPLADLPRAQAAPAPARVLEVDRPVPTRDQRTGPELARLGDRVCLDCEAAAGHAPGCTRPGYGPRPWSAAQRAAALGRTTCLTCGAEGGHQPGCREALVATTAYWVTETLMADTEIFFQLFVSFKDADREEALETLRSAGLAPALLRRLRSEAYEPRSLEGADRRQAALVVFGDGSAVANPRFADNNTRLAVAATADEMSGVVERIRQSVAARRRSTPALAASAPRRDPGSSDALASLGERVLSRAERTASEALAARRPPAPVLPVAAAAPEEVGRMSLLEID